MENKRTDGFFITDGYWLVMEKMREREEKKKYIWDIEDDGYYFEERF